MLVHVITAIWVGVLCAPFQLALNPSTVPKMWPGAECDCPVKLMSYGTAECVFTFALAYAAIRTDLVKRASNHKQNLNWALCAASVYISAALANGKITSGGQLNPALSFGITSASFVELAWRDSTFDSVIASAWPALPVFCTFQVMAGLLAALVCFVVRKLENTGVSFLTEFVASFVFAFAGGACLRFGETGWASLGAASMFTAMIAAASSEDCARVNPVVSLAFAWLGKISARRLLQDWLAQFISSILAMLMIKGIYHEVPTIGAAVPFLWNHAALAEAAYIFMLCFVASTCAIQRNSSQGVHCYALACGLAIACGGFSAGQISGASCFNPAMSLAIAVQQYCSTGWRAGLTMAGGSLLWFCFQSTSALIAAAASCIFRSTEQASISYEHSLEVRCVSEFIGTFLLVLTLGLNITMSSPAVAFSAAATLLCMGYALGNVSGGHFNPAITFAAVVNNRERFSASAGASYVGSQLLAGAIAGHAYAAFHAAGPYSKETYGLEPASPFSFPVAGIVESFATFVLVYVALATVAMMPNGTAQHPLTGFSVAAMYAAGLALINGVSGGQLNPAVCMGVVFANLSHHGSITPSVNFLPFVAWELSGAFTAVVAFRCTRPRAKSLKELDAFTEWRGQQVT
jgi:aquaporin Z